MNDAASYMVRAIRQQALSDAVIRLSERRDNQEDQASKKAFDEAIDILRTMGSR